MAIGKKIQACFREMFLCCTGWNDAAEQQQQQQERPLVISGPTNFRREEINIPGLTSSQERLIREKATHDAKKMWTNLSPLTSSPSGCFAERPVGPPPTYEEFTQPRSPPSTPRAPQHAELSKQSPLRVPSYHAPPERAGDEVSPGRIARVRAHGRKISGGFGRSRPATFIQPKGQELELGEMFREMGRGTGKASEDSSSTGFVFGDEHGKEVGGKGAGTEDRKEGGGGLL